MDALRGRIPANFDGVISSPLQRCTALAAKLANAYACDKRLVELNFGDWESTRWEEIDRIAFDEWANNHARARVPGGESWEDVRRRVGSFLEELRPGPYTDLAVVTHAGVIRAALSLILGIALEPTWRIQLPFGCVVKVEIGSHEQDDRLICL